MRRARAFTLVELMAVLVIAGVLAFVATSSWPAYWQRTRRAAAGAALVSTLAQLEVRHARTGMYSQEGLSGPGPVSRVEGYSIIEQPCENQTSSECVKVMALPDRTDKLCGVLVLRSTGERSPPDPACWP